MWVWKKEWGSQRLAGFATEVKVKRLSFDQMSVVKLKEHLADFLSVLSSRPSALLSSIILVLSSSDMSFESFSRELF